MADWERYTKPNVVFEGKLDSTTFIVDTDTKHFQFHLDQVDQELFELTIAAYNKDQKRKEYVLSLTQLQLSVLGNLIATSLKSVVDNDH